MPRLTQVMAAQQVKPSRMGLPPVFTSLTTSVLMPMAAMAMTIKNLLRVLSREKSSLAPPGRDRRARR